jgi:hypothetical protein
LYKARAKPSNSIALIFSASGRLDECNLYSVFSARNTHVLLLEYYYYE